MARVGINGHIEQRIIGGCRVAYDPRSTEQADKSRDPQNRKLRRPKKDGGKKNGRR
jgi:hypothetical protein